MEGTVKWFNVRKQFGFIQTETGEDIFVHKSALKKGAFLRENDKVAFEIEETPKGKQAKNVILLQKGSDRGTDRETKEDSDSF